MAHRTSIGGMHVFEVSVDPTAGVGVAAPIGSIATRDNSGTGEVYWKAGAGDTAWSLIGSGGGGETNTASNVGSGADVYSTKVGVDLRFRGINAASGKVTAVINGDNIDIDLGAVALADLSDLNAGTDLAMGANDIKLREGQKLVLDNDEDSYFIVTSDGGMDLFMENQRTWRFRSTFTTCYKNLLPSGTPGLGTAANYWGDAYAGFMYLREAAAAAGDTAGWGQIWAKNDQTLWFTDGGGVDHQIDFV